MNTKLSPNAIKDIDNVIHGYTNLAQHRQSGPRIITRGKGIYVYDDQGREYIEAAAGMWCANFGFSDNELAEAAIAQLRELPYYHTLTSQAVTPAIALAEKLASKVPMENARVYFALSGSEANDFLIKFMWYYHNAIGKSQKKKVISRINSYHGATVVASSLTGIASNHVDFDVPLDRFLYTHDPHYRRNKLDNETQDQYVDRILSDLEQMILAEGSETIMAFIAEPVTGGGGVIVPSPGYYEKLQKILKKYDILFLADEVITGFGRTGNMFGCETMGIQPDAMTLAKGLTGGYQPLSAIVLPGKICDVLEQHSDKRGSFAHGTTYSGYPVGTALGLRAMELLEERDIINHVREVATLFQDRLNALGNHPSIMETRGVGLLGALELENNEERPQGWLAAQLKALCSDEGLIVRGVPAGDSVALSPPLSITEGEINELFDRLARALEKF